jgi:hypothetical protein
MVALTGLGHPAGEEIKRLLQQHGLVPSNAASCPVSDQKLVHSQDGMLALMQYQLLLLLSPDRTTMQPTAGRLDLLENIRFRQLLNSPQLLELFLSSGDCTVTSVVSPKALHDRWGAAVQVLLQLLDYDSAAMHDTFRMRLCVACALAFSSPVHLLEPNEVFTNGGGTTVNPLMRYRNFVAWQQQGALFPTFRLLMPWQLRFVFRSMCSDEELCWARDNCVELKAARDTVSAPNL